MASVKGFVEKIKYRNEENGYTVLSLTGSDDGEEYILVGNFSFIGEGELLEASGHMTEHPVYGEQLSVESYEIKPPEDTVSMERYLGSGAIKGIGAALASRIVKKFKKDTFHCKAEHRICAGSQGSGALNGCCGHGQHVGGSVCGRGRVGYCHSQRNESPVPVISAQPFNSEERFPFQKHEKTVSGT